GVSVEERAYRRGEVDGYRLAVAATGDPAVNASVLADGEEAGVWVNSADDVDNCSFTLPAVVRRGPVMVAVSTGGHSPALARWLKERVAESIGPEYEVLAELLSAERDAIRSAGRSTEGLNWQSALGSDMLELIRTGQVREAKERLQACLSSS
ncbi:MAG: NAD(P)-dependent oxidoreductase, partial [Acidimicrobiales bacterium]